VGVPRRSPPPPPRRERPGTRSGIGLRGGSSAGGQRLASVRDQIDAVLDLKPARVEVRIQLLDAVLWDAGLLGDRAEVVAILDDVVPILHGILDVVRRR